MSLSDLGVAAPAYSRAAIREPVLDRDPSHARIGLRVEIRTTAAGRVAMDVLPEHRVRIHADSPVRGSCGAHRFVYTRGDIDIFPAGMSDTWQQDEAGSSLVVQLSPALLQRAAQEMGIDGDRAGLEPRCQFRDSQIEHIAWALGAERQAGSPSGLLYAESLGTALATRLLGHYTAPQRVARGLSVLQLRRVTQYIENHLDQDLSLAMLAGIAAVGVSNLKTLFKRSTGVPVHEYVVQRRVERAKALLMKCELPASQVALEAGFAHQSHMARCMRRVLGVAPAALARAPQAVGRDG